MVERYTLKREGEDACFCFLCFVSYSCKSIDLALVGTQPQKKTLASPFHTYKHNTNHRRIRKEHSSSIFFRPSPWAISHPTLTLVKMILWSLRRQLLVP